MSSATAQMKSNNNANSNSNSNSNKNVNKNKSGIEYLYNSKQKRDEKFVLNQLKQCLETILSTREKPAKNTNFVTTTDIRNDIHQIAFVAKNHLGIENATFLQKIENRTLGKNYIEPKCKKITQRVIIKKENESKNDNTKEKNGNNDDNDNENDNDDIDIDISMTNGNEKSKERMNEKVISNTNTSGPLCKDNKTAQLSQSKINDIGANDNSNENEKNENENGNNSKESGIETREIVWDFDASTFQQFLDSNSEILGRMQTIRNDKSFYGVTKEEIDLSDKLSHNMSIIMEYADIPSRCLYNASNGRK